MASYNYLLSERDRQWDNIKSLGILNEELERTRNNLLYDHDTLLIHARQMGYGHEDERFVRIVGLGSVRTVPSTAGNVYSVQKPDGFLDLNIKIIAFCLGFLIFAFLFMLEFIEKKSR